MTDAAVLPTHVQSASRAQQRLLITVLALALVLRLLYGLGQNPAEVYGNTGGDSGWYLANGYALVTGFDDDFLTQPDGSSYPIMLRGLPTPPIYLLFVGLWQAILPAEAAVIAIRILQALLGTLTCYLAYRLAAHISGNPRAGLLAAGVLAISPAFVMEPAQIATETLYIALLMGAFVVYLEESSSRGMLVSALLLGLATLTRAVLLLFPLGLALHLLLVYGWRRGLKLAGVLLVIYALVVSTWTIYSYARWQRFVIAGEGFAAFLYVGASPDGWQGGEAVDEALGVGEDGPTQDNYTEGAQDIIARDPLGYIQRRVSELAEAVIQPHGTVWFSGPSLKQMTTDWLREDRSLSGLLALTQGEGFWPKLALYIFHFAGILGGIMGMWRWRSQWRVWLPLAGFIPYTLLIHLVLTALPRYLFPVEAIWWVLAGLAMVNISQHS